jgi:hypothetical protein
VSADGLLGWYINGTTILAIAGRPLTVQVGLNLTVVGRQEAER